MQSQFSLMFLSYTEKRIDKFQFVVSNPSRAMFLQETNPAITAPAHQRRATHRDLPKGEDFYESAWNGSIGYSQAYS